MTAPTVNVTCTAHDQNGNPVAGALFVARLDRTEIYDGFVVPEQFTGVANADGVCVLQLWPNALGVASSQYKISAVNPDDGRRFLNSLATIPNNDCNLHEVMTLEPYPPINAAQQALVAAQNALAPVQEAATEALGYRDDALNSMNTTVAAASAASASADSAAASELAAQAAADSIDGFIADLAQPTGSALVGFQQAGTGAVATTVQSKLRESVSVKDFGAVGDGVADDTTAVQAAVTHCFTSGDQLYWPDGTHLTTASISNFHSVRHGGPGAVTRGADTFYPTPKTGSRNILYVAATGGSDTNDGLSAGQAFSTIKAAGDTIYKYPFSNGIWRVALAAGTYTQNTSFLFPFPSSQRVEFNGPSVPRGTTPTAVIDSPGDVVTGLFFQNGGFVSVTDVLVQNFSPINASGITIDARSDAWLINCHATNCYNGFEVSQASFMRVTGGIIQNCKIGFAGIARAGFTVGSSGTLATIDGSNGPAFLNNNTAIGLQEGVSGHADWCWFENNGVAMDIIERSRVHMMGSVLNGTASQTGVRCRSGSSFYDNPSVPNTWGATIGTRTLFGATSVDVSRTEYAAARPKHLVLRGTGTLSTSSLTPVVAQEYTFAPYELSTRGSGFELEMLCTVTGTAGSKNVTVKLGDVTLLNRTITASSAAYVIRVHFVVRDGIAASSQKVITEVLENGVSPIVGANAALTIDLKVAQTLSITHFVANGADTNRIQNVNLTVVR